MLFARTLRRAGRRLAKRPFVAALAIGSLAAAVSVTTAAFSTVDAYYLRSLPVSNPESLAFIYVETKEKRPDGLTWREYERLRDRAGVLAGLAVQARFSPKVRLPDRDGYPITAAVSDNFFDVIGVSAARGDVFHHGRGADQQVVMSDLYWRREFAADANLIGRMISVGPASLRVIGILPEGMAGTIRGLKVDLFVPEQTAFGSLRLVDKSSTHGEFEGLGRLRSAGGDAQAEKSLGGVLDDGRRAKVESFLKADANAGRAARIFGFAAFMLLFVAAANLVALRLVDNEARRRDWGIQLALGAGPTRLLLEHAAETLLMVASGGAMGIALAAYLIRLAPGWLRGGSDYREYFIRLDWRVGLFTLLSLLFVGLLLAVLPAIDSWRYSLTDSIRANTARRASRWLATLVTAQIALMVAMAYCAGLLGLSLRRIAMVRPAMDTSRPLVLVEGSWTGDESHWDRSERLASEFKTIPGVRDVAYARRVMLSGSGGGARVKWERPGEAARTMRYNQVSSRYFQVAGTRLLSGRPFSDADGPGTTPVVVVSAAFERALGRPAAGGYATLDRKPWLIVGVVEDGPSVRLREPIEPFVYFPFAQKPVRSPTFLIESATSPGKTAAILGAFLQKSGSGFGPRRFNTLFDHLRSARNSEEMAAAVGGVLTILSVMLSAAGLLGVTMYAVRKRSREFGIRMALGATPVGLARHVYSSVARYLLLGLPAGVALSWSAGETLRSFLFGVERSGAQVVAAVAGLAIAVAIAAAAWPALEAASTQPSAALRTE